MKCGSLCKSGEEIISLDPSFTNGNVYTLGEELGEYPTIFLDENDESKIIKYFWMYDNKCKNEGIILKKLNDSGFTPKYYGTYTCNESHKPVYIVMERIMGNNLFELLKEYIITEKKKENFNRKNAEIQFVEQYLDEIYMLYNVFMDLGIIQNDLFLQNIILGNDGKIYFIDFEFSIDVGENIPIEYRITKAQLLENLVNKKKIYKYDSYLNRTSGGKLKKIKKYNTKHTKHTKHKKHKKKIHKSKKIYKSKKCNST